MHKRDKRNNQYTWIDNSNEINASNVKILTITLLPNLFCILWCLREYQVPHYLLNISNVKY